MTGRPTRRFDIGTRGRIQRGYYAESTLLEAERMVDTVTFNHPRKHPASIPYVLANGQVAVGDDHCTGVLAGRRCHESGVQDHGGP
jgi:N-acyl-D-amino-acid deacylase